MINQLAVTNFKCFSHINFSLKPLTILAGANGSGKSSIIQAVLLARMAALSEQSDVVSLNGPFDLALGQVMDLLPHTTEATNRAERIQIAFKADGMECDPINFTWEDPEARYLHVQIPEPVKQLVGKTQFGNFIYLSAEREGPRESHEIPSVPRNEISLGVRGEELAGVLALCERDLVREELVRPGIEARRLAKQTEAWLQDFFPGIQLQVNTNSPTGNAFLRFKKNDPRAEWVKPANTGFGISSCLPILAAGLLAQPNGIFIVDTPEAHLHPAAQSKMGAFLARVAASGVQVIVETHSDHILNGVRVAVLTDDHPLKREDVIIHHFSPDDHSQPKHYEITINERGDLSDRPKDFFDQSERDLAFIVRKRFQQPRMRTGE